jgi:hypothetical protein
MQLGAIAIVCYIYTYIQEGSIYIKFFFFVYMAGAHEMLWDQHTTERGAVIC